MATDPDMLRREAQAVHLGWCIDLWERRQRQLVFMPRLSPFQAAGGSGRCTPAHHETEHNVPGSIVPAVAEEADAYRKWLVREGWLEE